jgi:bile acid:Na+ symporter, BASS family
MELLKTVFPLLISGSLFGLVLAVGLDATPDQLLYLLRRPARLGRAVMVVSVLTPAAAILLVSILPLHPMTKAGIIILSISPVPPFVPGRNRQMGASRDYSYGLFAAFALLAIVIVPVSAFIMGRIFGRDAYIGLWPMIQLVFKTVLLPLAVGLLIRRLAPALSSRASPIVLKFSLALLVVAAIPMLMKLWPVFGELVGDGTLLACVLFALAALALGHFMGDGDAGDRQALAITAATRHPGIAILVAKTIGVNREVMAAALLCFLICFVVSTPYQMLQKRRLAHPAGQAPPASA